MIFNQKIKDVSKIISDNGGHLYLVGGAVRDIVLNKIPNDLDFVVCGLTTDKFKSLFPESKKTGNLFPVYRMNIDDDEIEIAFARTEISTGKGHSDFKVVFSPNTTLKDDLYRRDLTMNAIAMDVDTQEIIDPYNGRADIKEGVLKAVSYHFKEDPLRVLRVCRFAAQFDMIVDLTTSRMMHEMKDDIKTLPNDRIRIEIIKALQSPKPTEFFRWLRKVDCLDIVFPEVHALIGQTQPDKYHPEGDAYIHTMQVLSQVADMSTDVQARFCALMHDIGKGLTPKEELPHHYMHEMNGVKIVKKLRDTNRFPISLCKASEFVCRWHMITLRNPKPSTIVYLLEDLKKSGCTLDTFKWILLADSDTIPEWLNAKLMRRMFSKIELTEHQKSLSGTAIKNIVHEKRTNIVKQYLYEWVSL